ncbi:MAG: 30S ribosomal protein S6 [Mollicutes bacterium]|jgi:small subunit ribosomal protein S6|nr:30S ribosomal protein S6 [Mollicutes bacterium]
MNNYEIMFIVKSTIEKEEVAKVADYLKKVITDNKGEIESFKELGQKELAYPIKKEISGYYFLVNLSASAEAIKEFDRKALIEENLIRHLIINLDKE